MSAPVSRCCCYCRAKRTALTWGFAISVGVLTGIASWITMGAFVVGAIGGTRLLDSHGKTILYAITVFAALACACAAYLAGTGATLVDVVCEDRKQCD